MTLLTWRQARDKLTGEEGDGLYGANEAQQILDDLAARGGRVYYRLPHDAGYLIYAGLDEDNQPRYRRESPL